ncbi:branched-chain amino acid aminotransferase [Lysinibacillus contaminans]|uniref:Branched-chain-amino-acid aminotransferase n=1 Tax=Lysinibacillus contaminans TaxID=1293441 RepID=A0ABR5JY09_9BACI|nr:branched-chain amino acid aminotransferase [Lysinibacillus contaminans]KOS67548.1 branched-chain amino acid aminotransferase [Lysinibacillus contaminans]
MTAFPIQVERTRTLKDKPDIHTLGFGQVFTDHMFVMDYTEGEGWHSARIMPYQPITLDPSAMVFHYGQTVFEGMKAYVTATNEVLLFRPERNFQRLNHSNDRMCIPTINEAHALVALKELVQLDREWIPTAPGTSLYIRPFIIATEPYLGVAASKNYQFIIIMSPVGSYYKEGLNPVKILVEKQYVRAAKGGTGEAKTGGNYASSLKAAELASKEGYAQTLWLDSIENKYIEEVGSMNIFFKINGTVITPALNGSILPGITRDSILHMLHSQNIPVEERRISVDEVVEAYENGTLEEAFGTGTAAVISPIGEFKYGEQQILVNNNEIGLLTQSLYDKLTGIQNGTIEDTFDWTVII